MPFGVTSLQEFSDTFFLYNHVFHIWVGSQSWSGMASPGSSTVCTEIHVYCLFSISALSLIVLKRRLLSLSGAIPVESFRKDYVAPELLLFTWSGFILITDFYDTVTVLQQRSAG